LALAGVKNALTKSEYILNNISIDKILETIPEELKHHNNFYDIKYLDISVYSTIAHNNQL
jgi:hypothetical protein